MTVLKISKLQGFVWKTIQVGLDGKSCLSHTNASNFRRPLKSLLLRYTAENLVRLPNFNVLFQLVLTNFFKSELFSCLPKVDHVIKSCKGSIGFG